MMKRTFSVYWRRKDKHWEEVDSLHEEREETKCCVVASKAEKEVCRASSQVQMRKHEDKGKQKKNILKDTEWSIERPHSNQQV